MKQLIYATCVFTALAALGMPAFAVDGVTLINQATVLAAGGFPYLINQSGSYRLSGNLIVASTGALNITASNVTLDFDGFSISCGACNGVSGISSSGSVVMIMNGTVNGFQGVGGIGISFQGAAGKVDHINANGNSTGVSTTGADLTVTESNISNNSFAGVNGYASNLNIRNSVFSGNGQAGIAIGGGVVTGSMITSNGLTGTALRGGIVVYGQPVNITNNMIAGNSVWGIAEAGVQAFVVGYGSNTFAGNGDDVQGPSAIYSMHNNVCSSGVC